ncbi:septum formation initiator family protein [bacterium]|nr:septum formation initiator family protein [bacterium]
MKDNNINNKNANSEHKGKKKIKYSLLTFVLIICIIELSVSAFNNINKNINFVSKIKGLENKRNEELDKNKQLKSDLENFNSEATLEAIARNNLKMAGKNEVLIIMNEPKQEPEEEPEKNKNKNKNE